MTFVDVLRTARASRGAVLHEFWTQYDPRQNRVHAFFEGHDDIAFFIPFIQRHLPAGARLYHYRCEGKPRVFEAFASIVQRDPNIRHVLFFVDKDIDDILGTPYPTDPRIFVTDVYSIENYLVTTDVLRNLYRDSVRLTGVAFPIDVIAERFQHQLDRFYRSMTPVMAWIVATRRSGQKPNLNNIVLSDLCRITDDCEVISTAGSRVAALQRSTGVAQQRGTFRQVAQVAKSLARIPAKRIIRGKFEAWFFVAFWKKTIAQLQNLAKESGGKADVKLTPEQGTFVVALTRYAEIPKALELFLRAHLGQSTPHGTGTRTKWQAIVASLKNQVSQLFPF